MSLLFIYSLLLGTSYGGRACFHVVATILDHLGTENNPFWRDHKSAKVNAIRTKTLIEQSDLAIIRFGEKYKQWNAAFDAGYCAALGTPYVTLHAEDIVHPLKEVDAAAMAWATTTDQVVEILKYITQE